MASPSSVVAGETSHFHSRYGDQFDLSFVLVFCLCMRVFFLRDNAQETLSNSEQTIVF